MLRRASYAEAVSLASSLISAIELPDPSEAGLMNAPHRPRQLKYQLLDGQHTCVMYTLVFASR